MKGNWFLGLASGLLAALAILSTPAHSATWHVEADGSGDFPTIQAAVDAANPGDTIQLGAGQFDDYEMSPNSPFWISYVRVTKDDLTIRGAGLDQSIIGQVDGEGHPQPVNVIAVFDNNSLTLEDLTIQIHDWLTADLLTAGQSPLTIRRCGFREASGGISYGSSAGVSISDCMFSDLNATAISARSSVRVRSATADSKESKKGSTRPGRPCSRCRIAFSTGAILA